MNELSIPTQPTTSNLPPTRINKQESKPFINKPVLAAQENTSKPIHKGIKNIISAVGAGLTSNTKQATQPVQLARQGKALPVLRTLKATTKLIRAVLDAPPRRAISGSSYAFLNQPSDPRPSVLPPNTLFRGDSRGIRNIFQNGFLPHDPQTKGNVRDHVKLNLKSDLISTSKGEKRATVFINNGYGQDAHKRGYPVYVYQIDPRGIEEIYDANQELGDTRYKGEVEITVRGAIPPENIVGAQVVYYSSRSDRSEIQTGPYIPNPNYTHHGEFVEEELSLAVESKETHQRKDYDDDDDDASAGAAVENIPEFISQEEWETRQQITKSQTSSNPINQNQGTNSSSPFQDVRPLPEHLLTLPKQSFGTNAISLNDAGKLGVFAAGQGIPDGIGSVEDAYYSGLDTLTRFFEYGELTKTKGSDGKIVHEHNNRKYTFPDGSYVEIQAHQPELTTTDGSNAFVAASFIGGGVATVVTGGLAEVVAVSVLSVVAVAGPLAGIVVGGALPDDAAWQGYTAKFVDKNGEDYATRYFYGWKTANNIFHEVSVDGQYDANKFPNFADEHNKFDWYTWKFGNAPIREGK